MLLNSTPKSLLKPLYRHFPDNIQICLEEPIIISSAPSIFTAAMATEAWSPMSFSLSHYSIYVKAYISTTDTILFPSFIS